MVARLALAASLLSTLAAALPITSESANLTSRAVQVPAGYASVLFQDDFTAQSPGGRPSDKWTIDTGHSYPGGPANWGTNEVQAYSASNVAISPARTLRITPTNAGGRWTSARIETRPEHDFACGAGRRLRMEAVLRAGDGRGQAGIWHAFWALGSAYRGRYNNWPSVGEIDIIETLNGLPTAWQTLHCGPTASGGPCHETDGISSTTTLSRGSWHTVAVEIDRTNQDGDWRGERISWLVDGVVTFTGKVCLLVETLCRSEDNLLMRCCVVTGATVGDATAWEALARSKKFLLLNVAVGGSFPDAIQKSRTPNAQTTGGDGTELEVKYVAVFTT
jgi:hypothetical protein